MDDASEVLDPLETVEWDQLLTRPHLQSELAVFHAQFRAELHEGLGGQRSELHEGLGGLHAELHRERAGMRAELHGGLQELRRDLLKVTSAQFFALAAAVAALVSLG